jgi:hypothetical protein
MIGKIYNASQNGRKVQSHTELYVKTSWDSLSRKRGPSRKESVPYENHGISGENVRLQGKPSDFGENRPVSGNMDAKHDICSLPWEAHRIP